MDILQKAEIHFYGRGKVSLYLQSNSSDQGEKFGEIALAAFHSVRMMSNLGHSALSERISTALEVFPSTARQFAGASMIGNLKVVEYPGYEGRTQFLLNLRITDGCVTFDVEPGVGYYAPASVIALEFYLARRRSSDTEFLRAFSTTLAGCAALYRSGAITLRNHAELILPILTYSCPDYCNCLT